MTICIAVQVNECLVFAADSAVTLFYGQDAAGGDIINVLPHGHKVFNLHRRLPVMAMTCGLGNIGSFSVATLAKDFRSRLMSEGDKYFVNPDSYTIEEIVTKARAWWFEDNFVPLGMKSNSDFSLYVGGYSSGATSPERWLFRILSDGTSPQPERLGAPGEAGLSWGGQPEILYRVVIGVGMDHQTVLNGGLVDPANVPALSAALQSQMQLPLVHPAMPVQDAIDLADLLVQTTKRFVRFLPGADTVGGDTDVAVVTRHEGFKWARRKHYFNSTLNPPEVSYGPRDRVKDLKPSHGKTP